MKPKTRSGIHLSDKLTLPIDVVTESIAIIGRKGSGKTTTSRVLAEDLFDEGVQLVVFDPLDVWWGIRLAADGKGKGCDVIIFGGSHGDVPINESAGKLMADLVVDKGISAVFSIGSFSRTGQRRFVADFSERIFDRKNAEEHRTPLHIVYDEADTFMPQKVLDPQVARCLSMADDIVRKGRSRGIGATLNTQRPAVLNKDVLAMTEILISMQTTAPQDRKALRDWVEANAAKDQGRVFLESLASLRQGEAWVWSPGKFCLFDRVQIRPSRTYDSSYTPKVGEKRKVQPTLSHVDLKWIESEVASLVQETEAKDPTKLKAKIKQLEAELAKEQAKKVPTAKGGYTGDDMDLAREQAAARAINSRDAEWQSVLKEALKRAPGEMLAQVLKGLSVAPTAPKGKIVPLDRSPAPASPPVPRDRTPVTSRPHLTPVARSEGGDGTKLSKAERAVLTVLTHYGPRSKDFVAAHAGYSANAGHFQNCVGSLHTRGLIEKVRDQISITAVGTASLGLVEPLPSGDFLFSMWLGKLGKCERAILQALRDDGREMTRDALAASAGYSAAAGHFQNSLGRLRGLNLITTGNPISITDEFWSAINS